MCLSVKLMFNQIHIACLLCINRANKYHTVRIVPKYNIIHIVER